MLCGYVRSNGQFLTLCTMETTKANFVAMLMDRLHGLEERVDMLQQENIAMKPELTISLQLDKALDNFSDGVGLWPYHFWNEEGCKLWYGGKTLNGTCSRPLDAQDLWMTCMQMQQPSGGNKSCLPISNLP